jgi:hypothetical protein
VREGASGAMTQPVCVCDDVSSAINREALRNAVWRRGNCDWWKGRGGGIPQP